MPTIAQIDPPSGCTLGPMTAGVTEHGVCLLSLRPIAECAPAITDLSQRFGAPCRKGTHPMLDALAEALDAYFADARAGCSVPLDTPGTPWERAVWDALRGIPPGQTRSYGQLARSLGNPGGARAVGMANRRNRVAILIPCHRVIAADGSLQGFAGGLDRKRWLLDHERSAFPASDALFGSCQETPA